MEIWTLGHSTRSFEEFTALVNHYHLELVIDVWAFPSSRRFPHFSRENMAKQLELEGVDYLWMGRELGGYRSSKEGLGSQSPNTGWKKGGFRNYADYMLSEKFQAAVEKVITLAQKKRVGLMCAERLYFRCHRQLIADYLTWRGFEVWHIEDEKSVRLHSLHPLAVERHGQLIYPAPEKPLF